MNINQLYDIYKKEYEAAEKVQRGLVGMEMYSEIYNKRTFEFVLESYRNSETEGFPSDEEHIKRMVKNQQSEWSFKQADLFAKYKRSKGVYMTAVDVLRDIPSAKKELSEFNEYLKTQNIKSGVERQQIISLTFFGSI